MIPVWPTELPRPMRPGFSFGAGDGRLRTRSDSGPPRVARRYSQVPDLVSMTFDFSRAELARYDRFFADEIRKGTLPFLMPDPTTSGWPLLTDDGVPLLTDEGVPLLLEDTWLVMLADEMPRRSVAGVRFRLELSLAVMP